jgi:hypothetical protein
VAVHDRPHLDGVADGVDDPRRDRHGPASWLAQSMMA